MSPPSELNLYWSNSVAFTLLFVVNIVNNLTLSRDIIDNNQDLIL